MLLVIGPFLNLKGLGACGPLLLLCCIIMQLPKISLVQYCASEVNDLLVGCMQSTPSTFATLRSTLKISIS